MCILVSTKQSHAQRCSLQLIDLNCNYSGKPDFCKSQDGLGSVSPAVAIMHLSLLLRTNLHNHFQCLRQLNRESEENRVAQAAYPLPALGTLEQGNLSCNNAHTLTCTLIAFPTVDYCRLSIGSGVY